MPYDGPMKGLAKRAFAAMKDTPGEASDDVTESKTAPDAGAAAGRAFAEAIKSGDGARVKSAFKTLYDECYGMGEEEAEAEGDA